MGIQERWRDPAGVRKSVSESANASAVGSGPEDPFTILGKTENPVVCETGSVRAVERLETDAVEPDQPRRRPDPQVSVPGLT